MKSTEYYLSKGFGQRTAAYFAAGRRTIVSVTAIPNFTVLLQFDNGVLQTKVKPQMKKF